MATQMQLERVSNCPFAPQAYQCKITQSTGMATQMQQIIEDVYIEKPTLIKKESPHNVVKYIIYMYFLLTCIPLLLPFHIWLILSSLSCYLVLNHVTIFISLICYNCKLSLLS